MVRRQQRRSPLRRPQAIVVVLCGQVRWQTRGRSLELGEPFAERLRLFNGIEMMRTRVPSGNAVASSGTMTPLWTTPSSSITHLFGKPGDSKCHNSPQIGYHIPADRRN